MTVNLTKAELKALIQRSARHTGVADSKAFKRAYDKLLAAWSESVRGRVRAALEKGQG